MEPIEAPVRTRYIIHTVVNEIKQIGECWFVHFEGSRESLCLSKDRPEFTIGDPIKITIEKALNAHLRQSPIE